MQELILLGASGNIGEQTLSLLRESPGSFKLIAVGAGQNLVALKKILLEFSSIKFVITQQEAEVNSLATQFPQITFLTGEDGYRNLFDHFPNAYVINAISGFAGLFPTLAALATKNRVLLLANKESLVMAGHQINDLLTANNGTLYPIDSEHCAIFQCLEANNPIKQIILTASGGMFANLSLEQLEEINDQEAFNHPNWNMGAKITIDSSTMMNKAFEVVEAYHLFKTDQILTVIHPESILHSAIQYHDNTIIGQMSVPSMLQVLSYFLFYPVRQNSRLFEPLNFDNLLTLSFQKADYQRWKALQLAQECLTENNSKAVAMVSANETLRELFINKQLRFYQIVNYVEYFMAQTPGKKLTNYKQIKELNDKIRIMIEAYFKNRVPGSN
ncbi:1-deoxy-D-xylulose 5-phosphate reductoisomerase [Spiroplasma syrphidicola EA-1]|uniref:1-deoxy-D-xylulose 5-phosphate reductoisomerase n=1 Tax=Spiroplasma syrphidicola EA-1 TaxID=1276229 RepID=R4UKZ8_9MOLU|nr:1-deoxy-D-xylulose-5-phosphate reductoisomerase [Spiroplasma syrphidicola]AGM25936.1 1-deoxy-D-xylulose 5-phosphate reductoisomerase [Spiroplasma syrphidicola EA-1]